VAIAVSEALADPAGSAVRLLTSSLYGIAEATGRRGCSGAAVFDLTLRPIPALEAEGFPLERARVVVLADATVHAYVLEGRARRFKHRNPWPGRDLCLQYPRDDAALRWLPVDGLEALISLVHRHLMFEEAWRRSGRWPTEDAPHGEHDGAPHPVLTPELRRDLRRWRR
jgi:hypothetical protein